MKTAVITADYLDHMGTDLSVVNAARVSFAKESDWVRGTLEMHPDPGDPEARTWTIPKSLSDADAKLISYLAKHDHWSPFAHTSVSFRVKAPIFVARQLVKHQVGGAWNEVSRRYVDDEPEFYFPDIWRGRPEGSIKQGSSGEVDPEGLWLDQYAKQQVRVMLFTYNELLEAGVAPEQARMVLPQNTMTEWIWTGSVVFWARVCRLRLDAHAQAETRDVAVQINRNMSDLFPVSWAALTPPKEEHHAE
jgi:thymidylate synthase (FAD)